MKKCKKYCEEGCGALKLALIITGSIVAAAGIILLLLKLFKRKHVKLPCDCCSVDSWDFEVDFLNELELDDSDEDETKGCDAEAEDTEEEVEEASEDEEKSDDTTDTSDAE